MSVCEENCKARADGGIRQAQQLVYRHVGDVANISRAVVLYMMGKEGGYGTWKRGSLRGRKYSTVTITRQPRRLAGIQERRKAAEEAFDCSRTFGASLVRCSGRTGPSEFGTSADAEKIADRPVSTVLHHYSTSFSRTLLKGSFAILLSAGGCYALLCDTGIPHVAA